MAHAPLTITTEVLEHADGRPIAYVDATAVVVFAHWQPEGACVIEIFTRENIGSVMQVLLDGISLIKRGDRSDRPCAVRD